MTLHAKRRLAMDGIGLLVVIAALALAWPGVRVAQADDQALMSVDPVLVQAEAPRAPVREARSCDNPGRPSPHDDAIVAHQIRRAMREYAQRVQAEGPQDPSQGIVLNGSGYNYKPIRPDPPLDQP